MKRLLPKNLAHQTAKVAARSVCLALLAASLSTAQSTKNDLSPAKYDFDIFAGAQLFHQRPDPLQTKLLNAGEVGFHFTENLWSHWSLEQSFSGSTLADLRLLFLPNATTANKVDLEQRVWKMSFNPVLHFTPLGSRVRPFLTAGFTEAYYNATGDGKDYARSLVPPAGTFGSNWRASFNYGAGLKVRFNDAWGMRVDVRGLLSDAPRWDLPYSTQGIPAGALYIPKGGAINGMEATIGLGYSWGGGPRVERHKPEPPAPTPPVVTPPAAPTAPRVFELSAIEGSPATGYAGENFNFSFRLNDSAHAPNITYACTIDGTPIPGITGPRFNLTPGPGTHTIVCTATDPATNTTASTPPYTFVVKPVPPLTITDSAAKPEIKAGETDQLTAQGSQSEYSGALTYSWRTNIGTINGTGSSVTFDSTSVQFDPANVFKPESRTATVTPTVTDQRGRTATGTPLQIRITKDSQAMRLDDIIYSKNGSRVNNCAKRILLDELQKIMNDNPDVDVLLIGHQDASESTKGQLDHQRVYNAAAVLTAGTGVCAASDVNRLKVSFAGTDQTSDFRSGFCGTSTRQKSDERKSDEIAADDATAKNRRVEIWIVPKGVANPAGAKDPQPAPVKIIKAKGCPH